MAEVLITLTIIGVIAAITIPTLSRKWSDHADVVKVKEAVSIINNAMTKLSYDEEKPEDWKWPSTNSVTNSQYFFDKISPYLKIKQCTIGSDSTKCLSSKRYNFNNVYYDSFAGNGIAGQLPNGFFVGFKIYNPSGTAILGVSHIGHVEIDINGGKGPNRHGYDIISFPLTYNGIQRKSINGSADNDLARFFNKSNCQIGRQNGGSCAGNACGYWILRKGNMDYKYRDVSAEW